MAVAVAPPASKGPQVAKFANLHLRQTKGRWAGERLVYERWQQDFVDEAFSINPATGRRWYREVLLGLPRKNGKSTIAGSVGLYLLVGDGENGPEVYVAAAAKDQARVVFDQQRDFVLTSPTLPDVLQVHRYDITCPENRGVMRVLSSDARLQHGSNPHGNVIDEYWAHNDPDLYLALTSGTAARAQPMTVTITTAGWDPESPLGQLYERSMALPDLEHPTPYLTVARDRDNGFLFWWYGAPEDADPDDPKVWAGCNPASWITPEYLKSERNKPSMREADFRRLHLNQWTSAEQLWLPGGAWAKCLSNVRALDPGLPVGVGIDMGQTHDSTAVVVAQAQGDEVIVRARTWDNPYPKGHTLHDVWKVSVEEIRAHLRDLYQQFPAVMALRDGRKVAGPAFAYDPWHFRESAEELNDDRLNMVEFPQFASRMGPASESLYELITTGRIRHDGDPVLSRHVANATAKLTRRGWVLTKPEGSSRKIDAAVAMAMAVDMALREAPKPKKPPRAPVGF